MLLRASDHLSRRSWALLASWYAHLTAQVRFGRSLSGAFAVRRGVRQGALLSPCLTNMFLLPLVQQLDDSNLGPTVYGNHIPVVAYADDLLMSSSARDLQRMLDMVTHFSRSWRLDFVNLNPSLTKSHCFIFGACLLAQLAKWHLCRQALSIREETQHLGVQLCSELQGADHINTRIRRGRGAFFGLMPAGMFSPHLLASDKAYLWRSVVSPALLYGCSICLLRSSDISRLEMWQASAIKSELRLPRTAQHTALMAALQIQGVHKKNRRISFPFISRVNRTIISNHTRTRRVTHAILCDIMFHTLSSLLAVADDVLQVVTFPLQAQRGATLRRLDCRPACVGPHLSHRGPNRLLQVLCRLGVLPVDLGLEVAPQEVVHRGQVGGMRGPRVTLPRRD